MPATDTPTMSESEVENHQTVPPKTPEESRSGASEGESRWRVWTKRIAAAILIPSALLVAVEVGLRFLDVGFPTDLTVPCTVHGRPASCYNLFFPAPFFPPGMIKTPQAYAIPAEKSQGTFRIFVLGES